MSKILLVAGHGDGDPGARGGGYTEELTMRELVRKIYNLIPNRVEIYPRNLDMYQARGMANTSYKNIIEFHMDASSNTNARGGHVIIHRNFSPDALDNRLRNVIREHIGLWSGVSKTNGFSYRSDLYNLNTAARRGISYRLLELGFITNSGDRQKTISNMDSLARKIAEAIINRQLGTTVSTPNTATTGTFHTVVRGDTLYSLSRRYGSTVNQIKAWNNLKSDTIVVGQRLRVRSSGPGQPNYGQNYYTSNPKRVRLIKRAGLYGINDINFNQGHIGGTYNTGTIFVIRGIKHSASGIPRLITQSNFLLTANRQYVVKY